MNTPASGRVLKTRQHRRGSEPRLPLPWRHQRTNKKTGQDRTNKVKNAGGTTIRTKGMIKKCKNKIKVPKISKAINGALYGGMNGPSLRPKKKKKKNSQGKRKKERNKNIKLNWNNKTAISNWANHTISRPLLSEITSTARGLKAAKNQGQITVQKPIKTVSKSPQRTAGTEGLTPNIRKEFVTSRVTSRRIDTGNAERLVLKRNSHWKKRPASSFHERTRDKRGR